MDFFNIVFIDNIILKLIYDVVYEKIYIYFKKENGILIRNIRRFFGRKKRSSSAAENPDDFALSFEAKRLQ